MSRYLVAEIDRHGNATSGGTDWATWDEAEAERYTLARIARLRWPDLGYRYEVREVIS